MVKKLSNLHTLSATPPLWIQGNNNNAIVKHSTLHVSPAQEEALKSNDGFSFRKRPGLPNLISPLERSSKFSKLSRSQTNYISFLIKITIDHSAANFKSNIIKDYSHAFHSIK